MADKDLRSLIAIARAKFILGVLLLMIAIAVLTWGITRGGKGRRPEALCGVANRTESQVVAARIITPEMLAYRRGEQLFKTTCASCHKPDQKMTGPALKGAKERWETSGGDIHAWVKNSLGYLRSHPRDAYAQDLFKQFDGSIMTPIALSNEEIDAILNYADKFYHHRMDPVP